MGYIYQAPVADRIKILRPNMFYFTDPRVVLHGFVGLSDNTRRAARAEGDMVQLCRKSTHIS